MLFSRLTYYLDKLEKTSSRLKITEILAELFKESSTQEIDKVCYLSLGRLAPKFVGLELNLAEKMMLRVIVQISGQTTEETGKRFKRTGDLGETIFQLKAQEARGHESKLSVNNVYDRLVEIAAEGGVGSQERKIKSMVELLEKLDGLSAKYVARIPVKKLRLGFSDLTVLDGLSWMKSQDKSLRKNLEEAFNVSADIGKIARVFKSKGLAGIKKIEPELGVPVRAAKAVALKDPQEILEKMGGRTALEPKYDGFRVQIHLDKNKKRKQKSESGVDAIKLFGGDKKETDFFVKIFSRNLDDMTYMFPDVVSAVQKIQVKSAILDGEAIAFNPKTGKFLPFQETVQRKRKHEVAQKAKEIPLRVFVFDILFLNGTSLLKKTFADRREKLSKLFGAKTQSGSLFLTEQRVVTKPKAFDEFFKDVVGEGLEGLMAKKVDVAYQAGARNFVWIKYKTGMQAELADTVDCIVMGYYRGKGKRTQFGIGAFLVGIPDGKGKIVSVSKIGTGLSDEQWREMRRKCQASNVKCQKKPEEYVVNKNLYADVWCKPELVVEIEADTITKSPLHTAGLALRFPRLKRFRGDKEVNQATSLKQLRQLASVE